MRALLPLLSLLAACGGAPSTAPDASPAAATPAAPVAAAAPAATSTTIGVADLKARMDQGAVTLVDVRTPAEYNDGHVPGAVNIPLDELGGRLAELEPHKADDVHLICAVGGRSAKATAILAQAGFTKATNVDGGTNGWRDAGYPVE